MLRDCIQSGAGEALYGIWVFRKGEDSANADAYSLLSLNLRHQQAQLMQHHDLLERQKAWSVELERGKAWLEEQWANWQRLAEAREQIMQQQQAKLDALAQTERHYHDLQSRTLWRILVRLGCLPNPS